MKLLTKHTDYAVRALSYLARHNERFVPSDEIARYDKIPAYFLRRVLNALIKDGTLDSKEGKNGGVRLAVKPRNIRIIDLIKLFQGDIRLSECMVRKNICPNRNKCLLRKKILKAESRLVRDINGIKLSDLIEK